MVKVMDAEMLEGLSLQARNNPRRRQNLNLHASFTEPSQRLLNAMEPGSYIRPHRHLRDPKPECFVGIRGRLVLVIFNDRGQVTDFVSFGPQEKAAGADLPPGVWHTVVSLEPGSVFFETKPGPFNENKKKDPAPWAPEEGTREGDLYLNSLIRMLNFS